MQTIPTAPLLAPLSSQSSPSSSFLLDQTTDTARTQSRKKYKPEDGSSSLWLDDKEDEGDGVSVDKGRHPEKSYWSDDSEVDEDEDVEDQVDDEDGSGKSVSSADDVNAKDQEAGGQAFELGEEYDRAAPVVLEEIGGEEAERRGETHDGSVSCAQ